MTELTLADTFPKADMTAWMALVEKALKGADFEKRLVSRSADGLAIQPLYTRADELAQAVRALPGVAPYVRGTRTHEVTAGWEIAQVYADETAESANTAILDDLVAGVTAITLQIAAPGSFGIPYEHEHMSRALEGVLLDVCSVGLVAGEYTPDAAGTLMALWQKAGVAEAQRRGAFNYDPLATLATTGALYHPLDRSLGIAAELVRTTGPMPQVTALAATGPAYHNAGATEAQELAAILASVVAYLRAGEKAGLAPAVVLPKIAIALSLDADQFLGIAKLRAIRQLIWRVADACGAGEAASRMHIAVETSRRMMAKRDPWANMLRTTIACAAAAMGGADSITVLPYTHALGKPDPFARRIARNTHHVLMEESGLGRVGDPAGGSWYVEKLSADLAEKSWTLFQAIEAQGGLGTALTSGFLQDEIGKAADTRARLIATGRLELTGSSAFPKLGSDGVTVEPWPSDVLSADLNGTRVKPMRERRLTAAFDTLRDAADAFSARTGKAPHVFLASLGPLAVHSARTTWIRNFLAAGGIGATTGDGFLQSADAGKAFAQSGASVACLCSSDDVYGELGEATASLLKTAGAKRVYLAGRPRDKEAALKAAGVDEFIFAGCDAIDVLTRLQETLDVV